MPEISANFVVQPYDITVTQENNNIDFVVEPITLTVYNGSSPTAFGNTGELQYNFQGVLRGAPNTFVTDTEVTFTNISNLKINGGNSGFYLQTDGSGSLTWAQGTANVSGSGTSAGANNQIQLSDGTGNFKVGSGFNFDTSSNILTVPGNISSSNVNAGNLLTANFVTGTLTTAAQPNITSVGTLTSLSVTGNVTAANVAGGNLVNANFLTGTLTTAAQPNITNLGNLTTLNIVGTTSIQQVREKVLVSGTGATGNINIDILDQVVYLYTANATANFAFNVRGNATESFSNIISNNQSITFTVINKNSNVGYFANTLRIDGTAATVVWAASGNTTGPPTSGTANGYDAYTFNLVRTNATNAITSYTVFGSKLGFS